MFFSLAALATVSLITSSALAADNLVPACIGLAGAFDTTTANFTLAAYYADETKNTNTTGVPLVLGPWGTLGPGVLYVLMTYASYPKPQNWPAFQLDAGRLIALGSPNVTNRAVIDGSAPGWLQINSDPHTGAQVYCGESSATGLPQLAANGATDQFALCTNGPYSEVIYMPENPGTAYDYSSCQYIHIHIVY
ncbi:uncharacterized protein BXZ73DRAFT_99391 [Epithele typhae]|uniref:uncharacterized protein n=1 Tax=Epithele typhae TaxID=378194 RepID=UPI002007C7F1|nr:uncharacterized protein BXZ73DRAFT_99391 [Epithele typhae]KAH9939759.1 hypothetical protein BXZ73DRAFT_99391 [Epithele typhae]